MRAFFVTHRMKTESSASSAAPITPVSSIPQFSSMYASRDSNSWGVRPDGMASSTDIDAAELKRINECVLRSGGGEHHRHKTRVVDPKECSSIRSHSVEYGQGVVCPFLPAGQSFQRHRI